jgi:capsular exopolysaccharide synthesis family protein
MAESPPPEEESQPAPSGFGGLRPAAPGEDRRVPVTREEIAVLADPRGTVAEQFRSLRNSIIALNPEGASRSIVFTSAVRGEGKSVATLNLAAAMAELPGTQVLVVDADLHHPALEDYLGLQRRQGLADVLQGTCPLDLAVRQTSIERVAVMGAGTLPMNPSRLLGSERMKVVLNMLKQRSSYVLVDAPEALRISDASLLGAIADGIVLVVRLESTPRYFVEQTHNQLEALGGNVLGTLLTGASKRLA